MPVQRDWARKAPLAIVPDGTPVKDVEHSLERTLRKMVEDPRWRDVRIDTPVLWEGELCTWGSLAGNEKLCVEFNEQGQLVGSYPI